MRTKRRRNSFWYTKESALEVGNKSSDRESWESHIPKVENRMNNEAGIFTMTKDFTNHIKNGHVNL